MTRRKRKKEDASRMSDDEKPQRKHEPSLNPSVDVSPNMVLPASTDGENGREVSCESSIESSFVHREFGLQREKRQRRGRDAEGK